MGTLDIRNDTPFLLNKESLDVRLKFDRTGPTTGRVSWNIPTPAAGCTADNQAYNGILVTLDTVPTAPGLAPIDGRVYTADPTGNVNLFVGDKISSALVVGAFYNDRTTTFVDVSGLQPNGIYYVAGYPHDAVNRYYSQGVYAYSLDYSTNNATPSTNGFQVLQLGQKGGFKGTDATGLIPNTVYQFSIVFDGATKITATDPFDLNLFTTSISGTSYTISINGSDAQTYDDLVKAINIALEQLQSAPISPTAPNTGTFFWDVINQKLFQWNGSTNVPLPVIVYPTAPNTPAFGSYWFNTTTQVLNQWNGVSWIAQHVIRFLHDPTKPTCDDYWFTGTAAYLWNGTTWCVQTLFIQLTAPSLAVPPPCGTHWFNETTQQLSEWNVDTKSWVPEMAILWPIDPNTLALGTFWFDETHNKLFQFNTPNPGWNDVSLLPGAVVIISPTQPIAPALNAYWYNPTLEDLKQWNGTTFVDVPVLVWETDPTVRSSCQLWWNTTNDNLYTWSVTTSSWDLITNFIKSSIDPSLAPILPAGDLWYNPSTNVLSRWDCSSWIPVAFIFNLTDPTLPALNDVWFNTTTSTWSVWNGLAWTTINPVYDPTDPTVQVAGNFWFNTTTNALNQWNGVAWISLLYTTTSPAPAVGTKWFDLINNVLKVWDGTTWQIATPLGTVALNSDGNLVFTSSTIGSRSTVILTDINLFKALPTGTDTQVSTVGDDGRNGKPSYDVQGIGTDGTPALRLDMVGQVLKVLGYPTIQVELSPEQLDFCVNNAIENLRKKSASGYKQGYFFLYTIPGKQSYTLTNKGASFDKIVNIMGVHRMVSAFLSTVQGAGAYGQIVLQHLYNMGTFDILSYFMVSQYISQLEAIFAARLTYNWNEGTRVLTFPHTFARTELLAIDATVERTEQDILSDRYVKNWILNWSTAVAKGMLADIRGKYATLPGAGGGVALNAAQLRTESDALFAKCEQEIDDFVVNSVEDFGIGTTFIFG